MFRTKSTSKFYLMILGLAVSLVWLAVIYFPDDKLKLVFCNVGQGDAILLVRGYQQILIDAGPDTKVLDCLSKNMPLFDQKIEVIALTHPEADHMTGLISVLDKYSVDYFLMGPEKSETAGYQALLKKLIKIEVGNLKCEAGTGSGKCDNPKSLTSHFISSFSSPISHITKIVNSYTGDKIKIGEINLDTLWPEREWVAERIVIPTERAGRQGARDDANDYQANGSTANGRETNILGYKSTNLSLNQFSLVFLLNYQGKKVLLMGDGDSKIQDDIIKNNTLLPIDILKFPHHGSKTGMTREFLKLIQPKEAVISVGKNSYGHPASETLDMLKEEGVKARRTDLEGEIKYNF